MRNEIPEVKGTGQSTYLKVSSWLLVIGLLLSGMGGSFAPWIWREAVALQLTAPGLAEFVKFLPEMRTGQMRGDRLYFLVPLFWVMLMLPLLAANKDLNLPALLRWLMRLAVIPLALASLSPVWTPAILVSAEFRFQTLLALASIGLVLAEPLIGRWPLKILVIALIGGNIAAVTLSTWQFHQVQATIAEVYQEPIVLGWGWWLMISGAGLSVLGSIGVLWPRRRE
jgi:hypothetical protein